MDKVLLRKFKNISINLKEKKGGDLSLFAVSKVPRDEITLKWDIFLKADWFSKKEESDLVFVIDELKKELGEEVMATNIDEILLLKKQNKADMRFFEEVFKKVGKNVEPEDDAFLLENEIYKIDTDRFVKMPELLVFILEA